MRVRGGIRLIIISILVFYGGVLYPLFLNAPVSEVDSSSDPLKEDKTLTVFPTVAFDELAKSTRLGIEDEIPDAETRRKLDEQAREYFKFRTKQLGVVEKATFVVNCISGNYDSLFCAQLDKGTDQWSNEEFANMPLADTPDGANDKSGDASSEASAAADGREPARKARISQHDIVQAFKKADVRTLEELKSAQMRRGLKNFNKWDELNPLAEKVLASHADCKINIRLLAHLGLKAEEFFPDPHYRELAIQFYEHAGRCGSKSAELPNLARLRAGLLHVWAGRCERATTFFQQLLLDHEQLHRTRALYWLAQCSRELGRSRDYHRIRKELLKVNPLAYHALAHNGESAESLSKNILEQDAPQVFLRTRKSKKINDWVRLVEFALVHDEKKIARDILREIREENSRFEPEFRLYLAILEERADNFLGKYRVLSNVFQEAPQFLTRATLEIFYPLKYFDLLTSYSDRLDPFFLYALIRQESGFVEGVRSPAGALGLMQLMPATARRLSSKVGRRDLVNPAVNVKWGVKYMEQLLDRFGGDAELSLAAYNAGPQNVEKWLDRYATSDKMLFLDLIPFSETRNYVSLIARNYFWYHRMYADELPRRNPASIKKPSRNARFHAFSFL